MGAKKGRSRYKPRPLAILTIPSEHAPVPGAETVRLRFFGSVLQDKVERAFRLRARRFLAESAATGFDKAVEDGLLKKPESPKVPDDAPKPTPLESALADWPASMTISECLHSIVAKEDDPGDDPIETPETPDDEREAWLADQSSGALEWLAEQQFDAAGLLRETEGDRGEG